MNSATLIPYSTTEVLNVLPRMLDENIAQHILALLKAKEGSCTSLGCIISIVSVDEIYDAEVLLCDARVKFCVRYTFQLLRLIRNTVYTGVVYKVYTEGMLVDVEGMPSIRVMTNCSGAAPADTVRLLLKDFMFVNNAYTGMGVVV